MNGTFPEVIAFIEGYTSAGIVKKARIEWHDFNNWLSSKLDYSESKVAAEYLREQYPADDEAINRLAYWYAEYARTHMRMDDGAEA